MRIPFISLVAGGALALGGCAYGDLGLGGYGSPYYSSGYGSPYYSNYYGGFSPPGVYIRVGVRSGCGVRACFAPFSGGPAPPPLLFWSRSFVGGVFLSA